MLGGPYHRRARSSLPTQGSLPQVSEMAQWNPAPRRNTVEDRVSSDCRRFLNSLRWNDPEGRWGYYVYCTFDEQTDVTDPMLDDTSSASGTEVSKERPGSTGSIHSNPSSECSTSSRPGSPITRPWTSLNDNMRIAMSKIKSYMVSEALFNLPAPYNSDIAAALTLIPIRLPGASLNDVREHFRHLRPSMPGRPASPIETYCLVVDNESLSSMLSGTEMVVRVRKRGRWKEYSGMMPQQRDVFVKVVEGRCEAGCRGIVTASSTATRHSASAKADPGAPVYHDWIEANPSCLRQLWCNSYE